MKKLSLLLILCTSILLPKSYAQKVLTSFDDQAAINELKGTTGVKVAQSNDYPALGAYSLKTIFPDQGGTVYINELSTDNWIRREELLVFIWTDMPANIEMNIQDSLGHSSSHQFAIEKGANHLQFPLSKPGKIDIEHIQSVDISANQSLTLYIDYISLDKVQPVLTKHGRWDIDYSTKIKTPHFSWASPLAGGAINTYAISPVFDGRGIIELSERLDLNLKATSIGRSPGRNRWGFGDFYHRRNPSHFDGDHSYSLAFNYIADDLLFGPEYDVIVWPGIHKWNTYPKQIRNSILNRVKNGAGLVLLYPQNDQPKNANSFDKLSPLKPSDSQNFTTDRDKNIVDIDIWSALDRSTWVKTKPHYITKGISLDAFPWGHMGVIPFQHNHGDILLKTSQGNPVLAVGTYGKGRVVAMSYPERGLIPRVDNPWKTGLHNDYWEYMWSLVSRSVVWAAQREPSKSIIQAKRNQKHIDIDVSNVSTGDALNLKIRDAFGKVEQDSSIVLSSDQSEIQFGLPDDLNSGSHIADLQLTNKENVYDWYSLKFETSKAADISAIQSTQTEIPVGESVKATIALKATNSFSGTLTVRLYDNYKRLIDQKEYPVTFNDSTSVNVVTHSDSVMTHLATLDIVLTSGNKQVDHNVKEFFFLQPRKWDDYDISMYQFGPNPVPGTWSAIDQQLKKVHVTTLAAYTLSNSKHANYKVQAQTRISGVESPDSGPDLEYYESMKKKYLKTHDKKILIRKYGLHDPVYRDSVKSELNRMIPDWRKFSPSAYYIYEEPSVTRYDDALDLSFSDKTLAAMRKWLKHNYGDLDTLNKQWETTFSAWPAVIPDDYMEAQKKGNYSSWADHRSFMEKSWADQFKFVQQQVQKLDPGGLVQLSGTQASGSHNGYDYSQIDNYVGQMNPYNIGNQLQFHHNFNPNLKVSGQAGYGVLGKDVLYNLYEHLFLNETGGSYIFWQASTLNPDLSLSQSGQDMAKGFEEMRAKGIGKLISSFNPANKNRVAIHYSYPSVHGSWIVDGQVKLKDDPGSTSKTLDQFRRDRDGWVKVLQDASIGFDFIAYGSIEEGGLTSKGYKTLVLPMSYALSDQEVAHIREFVKQGGTLIADAFPGVMDGHTRFRNKRALADVFGIEPHTYTRNDLITPEHEANLKVSGATPLLQNQDQPELLYHRFGKGTAFLLNYFLDTYPEEKLDKTNASSLSKIRKLLDKAEIKPTINLTNTSNNPAKNISTYLFTSDKDSTQLLGLLPDKNSAKRKISINLQQPATIYDIRSHQLVATGSSFNLKIEPAIPRLLGLVPGSIDAIETTAVSAKKLGEKVELKFQVKGHKLSSLTSVAHVDVFNPDGEEVPIYSDNCNITNSGGLFHFKTALNDQAGKWKIRITEVISGLEKNVYVPIK